MMTYIHHIGSLKIQGSEQHLLIHIPFYIQMWSIFSPTAIIRSLIQSMIHSMVNQSTHCCCPIYESTCWWVAEWFATSSDFFSHDVELRLDTTATNHHIPLIQVWKMKAADWRQRSLHRHHDQYWDCCCCLSIVAIVQSIHQVQLLASRFACVVCWCRWFCCSH